MDDEAGRKVDGSDFGRRLAAARSRQGLDPASRATAGAGSVGASSVGAGIGSGVGLAFRLAAELVAGLVVGLAIGWGLDRWLHTRPAFIIVFVIIGFAAGILNVMRIMGPERAR